MPICLQNMKQRRTRKGGRMTEFDIFKENHRDILEEYSKLYFIHNIWNKEEICRIFNTGEVPISFDKDEHEVPIIVECAKQCKYDIFKMILKHYDEHAYIIIDIIENREKYGNIRPVIQRILEESDEGVNELAKTILPFIFTNDVRNLDTNDKDIVNMIIESPSFDINYQDEYGDSFLMIAAEDEKLGMVRFLLDKGADIYLKNKTGRTAYDKSQGSIRSHLREAEKRKAVRGLAEISTFGKNIEGIKLPTLPNNILKSTSTFLGGRTRRIHKH